MKTSLIMRIVIGLIVGIVLGIIWPGNSMVKLLGQVFLGALKSVAPILVFVLVISSLANAGSGIGKRFRTVIVGLGLQKTASDVTKQVLQHFSDAIGLAVKWIINLAPIGIMGIVYDSISQSGVGIFANYGRLIALIVVCIVVFVLVVDPLIVAVCLRKNPYPLVFRCIKESAITAFFTRSSAANIPINMALCEKLGLDRDMYSVSIPLGATINMDGAAITITVMALAVANTVGVQVDLPTALMLSVVAAFGACGTSGVAGGSLLLIPMACSLFGVGNDIAMQAVGVGFIIGVIQDSIETAVNSSGDVLFTATAEFMEWKKQGKEIRF